MEAALGTKTEEQRRGRPKDPPLLFLMASGLIPILMKSASKTPLRVFMRWLLVLSANREIPSIFLDGNFQIPFHNPMETAHLTKTNRARACAQFSG
jgi:hypothetical protein